MKRAEVHSHFRLGRHHTSTANSLLRAILRQTGRPSSRWRLFKPGKEANATRRNTQFS
jgi:hypothetical protein